MNATDPPPLSPRKKNNNTKKQKTKKNNNKKPKQIQRKQRENPGVHLSKKLTPSFFYYIYDGLDHSLVMFDVNPDVLGLSKNGTQ